MKRHSNAVMMILLTLSISGCSRHEIRNESVPEESSPATPSVVKVDPERILFETAMSEMKKAEFEKAFTSFSRYLDEYVGSSSYEIAQLQRARAAYYLGKDDVALQTLRMTSEEAKHEEVLFESRLLYADILIHQEKFDEALAVTFDLMPDAAIKKLAGKKAVHPDLSVEQKVKTLTLRGQVYAELKKDKEAEKTLVDARKLLKKVDTNSKIPLTAHVAYRQLQTLGATCRNKLPLPQKISENEFVDFADAYYECITPARTNWCEIKGSLNLEILREALNPYRELVTYPVRIGEPLPPPSRKLKKEQIEHYEQEMHQLITKSVDEHSKEFKNIEACNAYNIF